MNLFIIYVNLWNDCAENHRLGCIPGTEIFLLVIQECHCFFQILHDTQEKHVLSPVELHTHKTADVHKSRNPF